MVSKLCSIASKKVWSSESQLYRCKKCYGESIFRTFFQSEWSKMDGVHTPTQNNCKTGQNTRNNGF